MSKSRYTTLQEAIPVFVRIAEGITWNSHKYDCDEEFPWQAIGVDVRKANAMFKAGQLYHSLELEKELKVGDGLEAMTIEELHGLVDNANKKVKANTPSELQYEKKKVKKSLIKSKQIGLLRSWRRNYGHFETDY